MLFHVKHQGGIKMDKERFIDLLAERGLTQVELASRAHVSRASIWAIMSRNRTPRLDTVGKIARVLGVKPSELLKA